MFFFLIEGENVTNYPITYADARREDYTSKHSKPARKLKRIIETVCAQFLFVSNEMPLWQFSWSPELTHLDLRFFQIEEATAGC
jgi:hypothetical protein